MRQYLPYIEDNPDFQHTRKLLELYRHAGFLFHIKNRSLTAHCRECLETGAEDPLTLLEDENLRSALGDPLLIQAYEETDWIRDVLTAMDTVLAAIRDFHPRGDIYYCTLYYTYFTPRVLRGSRLCDAIAAALDRTCVSPRTYYRWKREALRLYHRSLWESCPPWLISRALCLLDRKME